MCERGGALEGTGDGFFSVPFDKGEITPSVINICFLSTLPLCHFSCPLLIMSIVLQEFCFSLVVGGQRRGNELSCWGGRTRLADVQHHWWCRLAGHRQLLLAPLEVLGRPVLVAFYFSPDGGLILRDVHQDGS